MTEMRQAATDLQIAFIGFGTFGRALASLLEYNGLSYDTAEAGKLLTRPANLVFLTVPTQFMRRALVDNRPSIGEQAIIVNAAKGIEEKTHLMGHQIVFSVGKYRNYYSLIGPSFAAGIIDRDPTVVSLGYKDPTHLKTIKQVLNTPYFRVREAKGFRALELASALKNLYAITCGYAEGLGFGANTQAQLITTGLNEFKVLARAMHFHDYDPLAPGVIGDLVLTCSSKESRNFQYGYQLAKGGAADPQAAGKQTVEGYHTSHSINAIARQYKVTLPLANLTSRIIKGSISDPASFRRFLATH